MCVCQINSRKHTHTQRTKRTPAPSTAGKGTVVYKNGDKYEGAWANDMRDGLGTLWIFREGKYVVRYNGEWRDDQPTVSHRTALVLWSSS